jgi:hypothetical protein
MDLHNNFNKSFVTRPALPETIFHGVHQNFKINKLMAHASKREADP